VRIRACTLVTGLLLVAAASLLQPSSAPAAPAYSASLSGTEIIPISSRRGTFVGVSTGRLLAGWRVQIAHEPLASGPTVAITGGSLMLVTDTGRRLRGTVTGGSVTVTNRGSSCTNQTYRVTVDSTLGSFDGKLTHRRHSILGHCVIYAATIRGAGSFDI
jgi:hypothetical protein